MPKTQSIGDRSGWRDFIEAHPVRAFTAFLALHAFVWTLLPTALYPNLPLDLIEALTYGREWQLGYDKLPPLPWWLVEVARLTFAHDAAYYALAQVSVAVAFALVFATARPLVGATGALVAVLIVDGLHYFNYTAAKFNHDVIQLPFWALAGFALHRALRRGALHYWLLLGAAIGIAFWAKYFVVALAFPIAAFLLIEPQARACLRTPGPWLAALVAFTIMAPHLYWLVQNDFLPFAYAARRATPSQGVIDHLLHPLAFAVSQIGFLIPALFIALPLFLPFRREDRNASIGDTFDRRIVTLLAFGPFACVLAMSIVSGRAAVAMWGYPLFLFFGLWLVIFSRHALDRLRTAQIGLSWAVVAAGFVVAFIGNYAVLPHYDHRYRAAHYPGEALADEISARYRAATGKPLRYVIGTMWDGGNIGHYARTRPRVVIDGRPERAPWVNLADLRNQGAVVLWTHGDLTTVPPDYRSLAGDAQVQPPFRVPFRKGDNVLNVGWAILLGQPTFAAR